MKKTGFIFLLLWGVLACGKEESFPHDLSESGVENPMSDSDRDTSGNDKNETEKNNESVERPSDLDLVMNAVVAWSVEPDVYLEQIDAEMLEQQPESLTIEQLKGLVKIDAVTYDNGVYHFTEEDFLQVKLVDVKWVREQQRIEFRLNYRNMTGRMVQSLSFSLADYYAMRFKVNASFVETHYLQGVYQHADAFLGDLLTFDSERYMPEFYSKGIDVRHNTMAVTFEVYDRQANRNLNIQITKELRGFKPQDELLKAMMIGATVQVHEQAVEVMAKYDFKKDLKEYLKNKILTRKWMQMMEYSIDNQQLFYTVEQSGIYSQPVEIIKGQGGRLDVYLESPIWRLDAAGLEGRNLKLKMGLYGVNHMDLTGVSYDIVIPNVIR